MTGKKQSTAGMLLMFLRGGLRYIIAAIIAAAIGILFNFLAPQVVGFTVDSVIGDRAREIPEFISGFIDRLGGFGELRGKLYLCALGVVFVALLSCLFSFLSRVFLAKGTEGFVRRLRDALFRHTQYQPFSWHASNMTGDIIQRCTSDVETLRRFVSEQLIEVLRTVILLITGFAIMFSMNVTMTLIVLAFIPVILAYTAFFNLRIAKEFLRCDEAEGDLTVAVQENLTGVRVVRAFGREAFETARFDVKNKKLADMWIRLGYTLGVYWGLGDVVSAAELLTVIVAGTFLAASNKMSLGDLLIFISYSQTIAWPVRQMGRVLSEMSKSGVSVRRVKEIFDAPAEEEQTEALRPPMDREIAFENVSFAYGERAVLKNISFSCKNGETVGILGATGSGKSTLTYLLSRLYDLPEGSGAITIGGVDIRKIDKYYLRRNIGIVLQEPFLYSRTLFENIDIGAQSGDLETVRKNAETACIGQDIDSLPNKYETMVGERGVTLSGGQKQRVAIARALMSGAPVMVFDDSMSSLDMQTDAKILSALRSSTRNSTVFIVSHRISTLMHSDKIIVLEDGKITQEGTHGELIRSGGLYSRLYTLQSGEGEYSA